jgi:hypothetical protein
MRHQANVPGEVIYYVIRIYLTTWCIQETRCSIQHGQKVGIYGFSGDTPLLGEQCKAVSAILQPVRHNYYFVPLVPMHGMTSSLLGIDTIQQRMVYEDMSSPVLVLDRETKDMTTMTMANLELAYRSVYPFLHYLVYLIRYACRKWNQYATCFLCLQVCDV